MHLVDILEISCAPPYYDDQKKMTYIVYQISLGDQCPVYSVTLEVYLLGRHLFEFFTGKVKESFRMKTMHSFHRSHLEPFVFVCRRKFTRIIKLKIFLLKLNTLLF